MSIPQIASTTAPTPRVFRARTGQVAYGYQVGMLCAQWNIPFVPGDLNNASTFDYPIRYVEVAGVSGAAVLRGDGAQFTSLMVEAARRLEAEGVQAITGNCGFMAVYQDDVAAAVNIPVLLSSLVQIPMLSTVIGPNRKLGVMAANSAAITPEILAAAGVTDMDRLAVQGLQGYPHFNDVILQESGTLDLDRMSDEVVSAALQLQKDEPSLGAILLECSDLPPYAEAVHRATSLPVFEWASFIDYVHRAIAPRTFTGPF
ncbi:aspartate/glutamate racemase family protein [Microbacterium trichothecenolyticum]|uniref:Aspartate/glutamate racemase family protein n=1 Tax=Microbacterium ureisolvens TaxID=2781186 RepID=A0ABS7I2W1_9MICO|nr:MULTISPECIES: aspartate/glutamate racemase family protein [Microbacterium]MBW9111893.1 aspartate/glutamate racemase family protein [Microbacterium ureisolvens]MBW9122260.1 aspartate/glutamate racemase family protein [Microbacterium trichothecenolyticum]